MNTRLKAGLKTVIPTHWVRRAQMTYAPLRCRRAKRLFALTSKEPLWLDLNMIDTYQRKYPLPPPYGYDPDSTARRGKSRARHLLNLVPARNVNTFLEMGCWDGMVSFALQQLGKETVAVDNRTLGFDERAIRGGAKLLQMDASHLQFEDNSFDVVFSYDTFEHLARPEEVLREATRVVKKDGYVYHEFGPTYLAPGGAHLFRQITVPYCHILFHEDSLRTYACAKGLGTLDFQTVNRYTVEDFRMVWKKCSDHLKLISYHEVPNLSHVDLIEKHPSCFAGKSSVFENFIINHMSILFQKTD